HIAGDGQGGINELVDEVSVVSSEEALCAARELFQRHRLCVGTSSGANFVAARRLKERFGGVAAGFADGALKYRSSGLETCTGECELGKRCQCEVLESLGLF